MSANGNWMKVGWIVEGIVGCYLKNNHLIHVVGK